jgi:hypothetical protein
MLKGRSSVTGLTEYFPTLANTHSSEELVEMISGGRAKPLPLELSHVMDSMWYWGVRHSFQWYQEVVCIISEALDNNGEGVEDKRNFVRRLLSLQIKEYIELWFAQHSVGFDLVFIAWINWFNSTYSIGAFDNDFCFRWVAIKSFDTVKSILDEIHFPVRS